jgi:peptidoglycan/LPS O-acetylase OafA/YrhL
MRVSLADRLTYTKGRPSGFDYLRLGLALAVVFVHSRGLTSVVTDAALRAQPDAWVRTALRANSTPVLPMFFALSGFLVAGSLERSKTLLTFLSLRVIRIYPALAVEVILSALLVGTMVTSLPLGSYFRHPMFWEYLLNVIGDVHFTLPGVFENNPHSNTVNGQLWTVPYELLCYVLLAVLVLVGAVRRKVIVPLATAGLALAHLITRLPGYDWQFPVVGGLTGEILVLFFLAGVSFYLFKDKIPWSYNLFFGALMASILLIYAVPFGEYPAAVTLTYVTVYLGLTNVKRLSVVNGADYSYGMYIYHCVIIQLFIYLAAPSSGWITLFVCVPMSAAVAAFSWHFVEKPTQKLRTFLPAVEQRYLALKHRLLNWAALSADKKQTSI